MRMTPSQMSVGVTSMDTLQTSAGQYGRLRFSFRRVTGMVQLKKILFGGIVPVMCMASITTWMAFAIIWLCVAMNIATEDKGKILVLLVLTVGLGAIFLISSILALFSPFILKRLFSQHIEDIQARFFGIEGHPELEHVESILFGHDQGRIQWVSSDDPEKRLQHAEQDDVMPEGVYRRFTLVDTLTLLRCASQRRILPTLLWHVAKNTA
jgi:hypothetical protein